MNMSRSLLFLTLLAFYMVLSPNLYSGEMLLYTGFEADGAGAIPEEPPDTWQASGGGYEVVNNRAKEGKKSLGVISGGGDQALAAVFETQSAVISAEFWLYVDGVDRSLTFFVQDPNVGLTDWANSGPYVNWIADGVRHYPGAWEDIGPFSSGKWHYARFVVDLGDASYKMYVGNTREEAHASEPLRKDLGFRTAIAPPPGKVLFGTYGQVTPAYVDELLVYEGDVIPEGFFAVTPGEKLTMTWGEIKSRFP